MNDMELQTLTEYISENEFKKPFKHHAYFNKRLRTTGGRYLLQSHDIEINPRQYENFGTDAIINIIKHELCHYHLHIERKGYRHRDKDFKILSEQVNAPRFCTPIQTYEERANYVYMCNNCKQKFLRIRKVNTRKMRCGKCGGKLVLKSHKE